MAIDRAAILRNAEKLLRQGKLDAAIAEYLRVVEDQPQDWNTANILGDLHLRAGQADKAVEQFVRAALVLSRDGFLPKAAAVYKRILKIRPGDEHAMQQAGEIAAKQGVLVEARAYLTSVADRRAARGDEGGAAEIRGRLFDAYVAAGDLDRAREFAGTTEQLTALGQAYAGRGEMSAAAEFLAAPPLDADPELLLTFARTKIAAGAEEEGLGVLRQLLNQDSRRSQMIAAFAWDLAPSSPDVSLRVAEVVAETALIEADWAAAAGVFQQFAARVPHHVPALMRLVEICFDGGLDAALYAAQWQLADAYLAAGAAAEARVIAEDLTARNPGEPAHVEQLRRALTLLGEADPDAVIADLLQRDEPDPDARPELVDGSVDGSVGGSTVLTVDPEPAVILRPVEKPRVVPIDLDGQPAPLPRAAAPDVFEIDLTTMLADFHMADLPVMREPEPVLPEGLDEVFERFRESASMSADVAREEYDRAMALRDAGRIEESIQAFELATREPRLRFLASAALAAIYRQRNERHQAVEWLERAAQAPPPSADEAHALLFELADTLESLGEIERALAVCLELQAEAGSYRDVTDRITRLTRVLARG